MLGTKSVVPLAIGLSLLVGLLVAVYLFGKSDAPDYVERPAGFEFRNHHIVHGQATFTVEGELVNVQNKDWERVQPVVSIYAGVAYMTYCRGKIDSIKKQGSQSFRIVCRETAGSNLPDNISYELAVKRAVLVRKTH